MSFIIQEDTPDGKCTLHATATYTVIYQRMEADDEPRVNDLSIPDSKPTEFTFEGPKILPCYVPAASKPKNILCIQTTGYRPVNRY